MFYYLRHRCCGKIDIRTGSRREIPNPIAGSSQGRGIDRGPVRDSGGDRGSSPARIPTGEVRRLVIDALDEGRIFSGDNHIEAFLRTTLERLNDPAAPKGQGPKLLFFGRPAAIDLAAAILELEALHFR